MDLNIWRVIKFSPSPLSSRFDRDVVHLKSAVLVLFSTGGTRIVFNSQRPVHLKRKIPAKAKSLVRWEFFSPVASQELVSSFETRVPQNTKQFVFFGYPSIPSGPADR